LFFVNSDLVHQEQTLAVKDKQKCFHVASFHNKALSYKCLWNHKKLKLVEQQQRAAISKCLIENLILWGGQHMLGWSPFLVPSLLDGSLCSSGALFALATAESEVMEPGSWWRYEDKSPWWEW